MPTQISSIKDGKKLLENKCNTALIGQSAESTEIVNKQTVISP